jgi:hypothetical protein
MPKMALRPEKSKGKILSVRGCNFFVAALSALILAHGPQIPKQLKDLAKKVKLPSVGELVKRPRPLALSPQDFFPMANDRFDRLKLAFKPMEKLNRTPSGGYEIPHGAYEGWFQTYCLGIGLRVAEDGHGTRFGQWTGSRHDIVHRILSGAAVHSDIPQGDIQSLLWAILAEVKPQYFGPKVMAAAKRLLRAEDLGRLQNSALDELPEQLVRQAAARMPPEVRELYRAEAQLRNTIMRGGAEYARMEQIAVPPGKSKPGRVLPEERWSFHPEGYMIRMRAFGYSSAHIQIVRPRPLKFARDDLGRIIRVSDRGGPLYEITYRNDEARPHSKIRDLIAYRFAALTVYRRPKGGDADKHRIEGSGYTFVHRRSLASKLGPLVDALPSWFQSNRDEPFDRGPSLGTLRLSLQEEWEDWIERGQQAQETYEEWKERGEWADRILHPRPGSIEELGDREHLQDGIEAATSGDPSERVGWIAETHQRANEGLLGAIDVLSGLPTESTPDFEPERYGGLPADAGSQGLGISSRGAPRR